MRMRPASAATNPLLVQVQDKTPHFWRHVPASPPPAPGLVPAFLAFSTAARRPVERQIRRHAGVLQLLPALRPESSFATATALSAPQCQGAPASALLSCGFAVQQALAAAAGFPVGVPGVPVPFNSVDTQVSNGNSWYNALTLNLEKRFSQHFELLSSLPGRTRWTIPPTCNPRWSRKTAVSPAWSAPTPSTTSAFAGSPAVFSNPLL